MSIRNFVLLLVCFCAYMPFVHAQIPAATPSKPEIEQIVKDYILQHPEVLLESVRMYQERERTAKVQKSKDVAAARQDDLIRDPTSPATKPLAPIPSDQITMVEFFDYRCGYCKRVNPTLMKMAAENPKLRLVFKEFPILGPESVVAAKAALAAEKQGKYLAFNQAMMALTTPVNAESIDQVAAKVGLDVAKMKADMESPAIAAIIAKNTQLATAIDITATPAFVVGNEVVTGALDQAGFDRLLAKAKP